MLYEKLTIRDVPNITRALSFSFLRLEGRTSQIFINVIIMLNIIGIRGFLSHDVLGGEVMEKGTLPVVRVGNGEQLGRAFGG